MLDLWPKGIENLKVKSPVAILREQASILGEKTKNLVQAEVTEKNSGKFFTYTFFLVAPALNNYRYELFDMYHDISLYPVDIGVEEDIFAEIESKVKTHRDEDGVSCIGAESEDEFVEVLRAIFNSKKSIQVITALLSQSDPYWFPQEF